MGTRLWLDTGDIDEAAALWCCEFDALTTNNTLLNKEIQKGSYYDLIREAAEAIRRTAREIDEQELVLEIAFVLNARHALKLVERFDAHGAFAHRPRSRHRRRWPDAIHPSTVLREGAADAGRAAGGSAARPGGRAGQVRWGFSARQNPTPLLASLDSSAFLGQLNAFVADNKLGDGRNIGEKATLATQGCSSNWKRRNVRC